MTIYEFAPWDSDDDPVDDVIVRPLLIGVDRPDALSGHLARNLLGYWVMWSQCAGGRAEMIERGWVSRRTAFELEATFRDVVGLPVSSFDPSMIATLLLGEGGDDAYRDALLQLIDEDEAR